MLYCGKWFPASEYTPSPLLRQCGEIIPADDILVVSKVINELRLEVSFNDARLLTFFPNILNIFDTWYLLFATNKMKSKIVEIIRMTLSKTLRNWFLLLWKIEIHVFVTFPDFAMYFWLTHKLEEWKNARRGANRFFKRFLKISLLHKSLKYFQFYTPYTHPSM